MPSRSRKDGGKKEKIGARSQKEASTGTRPCLCEGKIGGIVSIEGTIRKGAGVFFAHRDEKITKSGRVGLPHLS